VIISTFLHIDFQFCWATPPAPRSLPLTAPEHRPRLGVLSPQYSPRIDATGPTCENMKKIFYVQLYEFTVARGTTAVQSYNVTIVRSTTYSFTQRSTQAGLNSTVMTWINNVTTKPLTLCIICATT